MTNREKNTKHIFIKLGGPERKRKGRRSSSSDCVGERERAQNTVGYACHRGVAVVVAVMRQDGLLHGEGWQIRVMGVAGLKKK